MSTSRVVASTCACICLNMYSSLFNERFQVNEENLHVYVNLWLVFLFLFECYLHYQPFQLTAGLYYPDNLLHESHGIVPVSVKFCLQTFPPRLSTSCLVSLGSVYYLLRFSLSAFSSISYLRVLPLVLPLYIFFVHYFYIVCNSSMI